MQNAFSPTSKVSIVYRHCLNVQSPKSLLRFKQSLNCNPCTIKMKRKIACFQHTVAQDTHHHPEREERERRGEVLDQSKTRKIAEQTPNSASPHLMSKSSSALRLLLALLTTTHFFLLDWFHTCNQLSWAGRYPTALASPTFWISPRQSRLHLHNFRK